MDFSEAFGTALRLIVALDRHVLAAVAVSLQVSLLAILLATACGIPLGFAVAARSFRGRRVLEMLLNTLTALPTVVVGLLAYMLLARRGPLGPLGWLYTRTGMVFGETLLVTPLMAALTAAVVAGADPRIEETALTLGASRSGAALTVLRELPRGLLAAVATGFGRLIGELGVALMVGGNIEGATRTMTTAIALETSKGEFALAFALGLILLAVALAVNVAASLLAGREAPG
ncbi:MAG: ABC transporter permease [Deltaproteobacteria bacterium]|nr:ABC transporter permease [Deltaproteobacteria bacterium]